MSGLAKPDEFRRVAGRGEVVSKADLYDPVRRVNRLIDHGNYLCYGMAGAALWALGIPPHLSLFHGKTRAGGLVFDLADAFKDALVLPLAFAASLHEKDGDYESTFRAGLISAFDDQKILGEAIATVEKMISAASEGEGDHA